MTNLQEELLNQLAGLHFVQFLDTGTEELLRQVFGLLLGELVFMDDTQNKSALTIRAVPAITSRFDRRTVTVAVHWVGVSVRHNMEAMTAVAAMAAIGPSTIRHETGVLNFLINRLLKQTVESGDFSLYLGDVVEFRLDRGGEAVATVVR